MRTGRALMTTAALLLGATALAGCGSGGGSASGALQEARDHASAVQEQLGSAAPAGESSPAAAPAAGGGLSAEDFCQVLRDEQPHLDELGPGVRSMAQLTIAIADAYDRAGALEQLGATDLDELAATCPQDRDRALESAQVTSFRQL